IRLDRKNTMARNNLGNYLRAKGNLVEAIRFYKEALRLDPKFALARGNLHMAERWQELLPRLPDVLAGRAQPTSAEEGCEFAELLGAPFQKRYYQGSQLYAWAFAASPKLADKLDVGHRYNAACCAALAAAGKDPELTTFGIDEWCQLTGLALKWL